jgi:rubrerythrin
VRDDELSRRRLLAGTGAGAVLTALLGGCGSGSTSKRSEGADLYKMASEERFADAVLLSGALDVEARLADVYALIASAVTGRGRGLVGRIAAQERAHTTALVKSIQALGGQPPPANRGAPLRRPRSATEALRLASATENEAIAFYIDALPKLSTDNKLRSPVATIMTNEAEHLALLSRALGEPAAPQSIVRGRA